MRSQPHPPPPPSKPEDEPDLSPRPNPTATTAYVPLPLTTSRKKGTGVRAWLLLDATGQAQVVEAGKHAIMRRTGLPARDLRILDPLLSYPSTVLGREKAIVINLEHIKAIITAQEVLLLNSRDPSVIPFVEELKRRLLCHHQASKAQDGNGEDSSRANMKEMQSGPLSPSNVPEHLLHSEDSNEGGKGNGKQGLENRDGSKVLPFEFVALEACLEAACSCLENEAKTLELEAHPALDKLTSKISTLNLERVRQIKSRLVAITGRVQKVRDELEHLLDDDEDMAEMYLTEKLIQLQLENSSSSSLNERDYLEDEDFQADMEDSIPATASLGIPGASTSYEGDIHDAEDTQDHLFSVHRALSRDSHGTHTSTTRSAVSKHFDIEELEMLLEAYFVQIDGTLNKLSTLREYVDDTEDYINIMLDDKQNHLLQMGVMLTTATLVVSCFVVVAGIFGMNIKIEMFKESVETGMPKFLWTVGGGSTGCILLYVMAIAWCKHKRLLE
ncbi:Magnesium transporter MRS2-3 [Turnera subulata]|uniref:Magnesium transporter n=1 Tax=Turnera subulata TaxID=218843 RepID=A0A9Q0J1A8_9ROSI|nr:Magnesium transporter MRS2-3 [Turnera subulata]